MHRPFRMPAAHADRTIASRCAASRRRRVRCARLPAVRRLLVLASCVLVAACSSTDSQPRSESTTPNATSPSPTASTTSSAKAVDSCDLLSEAELAALAGEGVSEAHPGLTGGLANCQWATADGGYVQTAAATAPEWAQSLPEMFRAIEASGRFTDAENLRKLREGARLVQAGKVLSPVAACALFSEMLELQGQPAGTTSIVNVVPSREDPQAITGQMCSGGRFTSVMIASQTGLDEPLPVEAVASALRSAHRRSMG